MPDLFRTIRFRLTLWFTGIFSVSAAVAFILFYYLAVQTLQGQIDQELLDKASQFSSVIRQNGLRGAGNLAVIESKAAGEKMIFFRLLYPSGEVFASSHMSYWKDIQVDHAMLDRLMENKTPVFDTRMMGNDHKARILYAFVARNAILQTGITMESQSRLLSAFKRVFMVAMGFIVGFSALSGSSLAAALTMGRVSLPEMQRFGYDNGLATGAIAAGGTLGILIPPSAGFVVYAILTEESIGRLFMAGVVPGILLTGLFIATIWLVVARKPDKAPQAMEAETMSKRLAALGRAFWIIGIIVLTIGGIYTGVFSAVEAAGIGAFLALIVTVIRRAANWANLREVVLQTLKSTGTVFLILFGAFVFKTFVGFTGIPFRLTGWVEAQGFGPMQVVVAILIAYIVLGTFLEGFAILVLTIPLVQPILQTLGVDLIWFGVLIVIVLEMALISPPVGINVFVVKGIAENVTLNTIFRGIWPFWFAMLLCTILVLAFPALALFLPNSMFG